MCKLASRRGDATAFTAEANLDFVCLPSHPYSKMLWLGRVHRSTYGLDLSDPQASRAQEGNGDSDTTPKAARRICESYSRREGYYDDSRGAAKKTLIPKNAKVLNNPSIDSSIGPVSIDGDPTCAEDKLHTHQALGIDGPNGASVVEFSHPIPPKGDIHASRSSQDTHRDAGPTLQLHIGHRPDRSQIPISRIYQVHSSPLDRFHYSSREPQEPARWVPPQVHSSIWMLRCFAPGLNLPWWMQAMGLSGG